ncbi:MAG: glycosyltransferase [Bacteroidetes bacterium]|nr:glycosyltransferase [Bacteroidota bacterium]
MTEAKNVLAVVVTYNRLELLKRCVVHLQQQEACPDLLIINNTSPDGTEAWLKAEKLNFITQPNGGSSAGWKTGIEQAINRGYEYVWLMDDDGFSHPEALKKLLANITPETAILSSIVVKENKPDEFVFGLPVVNNKQQPVVFARKRKYASFAELPQGIRQYPFAHLFNGALINLSLARKTENVNTGFFIYGDEVDYYCRMLQQGQVKYQLDALHFHPDVSQRVIDKIRVYYYIRNTIILNNRYFDLAPFRNLLTVGVALARLAKRNGPFTALSYVVGSNAKYVWMGITDGLSGRFIKRY